MKCVGIDDHNKRLEEIADRLYAKNNAFVHTNMQYNQGSCHGEADIVYFNPRMDLRFIEYKCRYSPKNYDHACEQFTRFKDAYGHLKLRGIYIAGGIDTPIVVKRLRYVN